MSEDLISRQAAIDATWFEPSYTDPLNVLTEVRDRLKALPSAPSERKKGLWLIETKASLKSGMLVLGGYRCSVCDFYVPWDFTHESPFFIEKYNFCPNCGSDTRKGEDD